MQDSLMELKVISGGAAATVRFNHASAYSRVVVLQSGLGGDSYYPDYYVKTLRNELALNVFEIKWEPAFTAAGQALGWYAPASPHPPGLAVLADRPASIVQLIADWTQASFRAVSGCSSGALAFGTAVSFLNLAEKANLNYVQLSGGPFNYDLGRLCGKDGTVGAIHSLSGSGMLNAARAEMDVATGSQLHCRQGLGPDPIYAYSSLVSLPDSSFRIGKAYMDIYLTTGQNPAAPSDEYLQLFPGATNAYERFSKANPGQTRYTTEEGEHCTGKVLPEGWSSMNQLNCSRLCSQAYGRTEESCTGTCAKGFSRYVTP